MPSGSCDSVCTVTSGAAAKLAVVKPVERHVSRREKRTAQNSNDGRLSENFWLCHVLGALPFLLPFRSLMALHMLCRVTRAISKVIVKLRRYHSLVGAKKKRGGGGHSINWYCKLKTGANLKLAKVASSAQNMTAMQYSNYII